MTAGSIASAEELSSPFVGTVSTVLEGDVLEVVTSGGSRIVRVFGVDSPDDGQPGFDEATSFTRALVEESELVLEPKGTDISDRLVCEVVLRDGRNLSRELAREGWAWRYKVHTKKDLILTRLTFEAMESKQGFWAFAAPLAPWDFRGERMGDELFFPFVDEPTAPVPVSMEKSRTIDLTATDSGAVEKSVTINPDGSRRLVLKGNHKQTAADVAFNENSNRIMRQAVAQRAEEKRAGAAAYQNAIQSRIQTSIDVSESRQQYPNGRYGFGGPVIISGGYGFPRAVIFPPTYTGTTSTSGSDDLWPYVRSP
jgi:endonuclease YncB( thermonuclease family)